MYRVTTQLDQEITNEKILGEQASRTSSTTYTDIKRGKNGKMLMVRHKAKGKVIANGTVVTTEEAKKDVKAGGDRSQAKEDSEKPWTTDEDAKLKNMKTSGKTWAEIGEEIVRPRHELQTRWKEINKLDGGGDGGKGEAKNDNTKHKAAGDVGGDLTKDETKKVKELLANKTSHKQIADQLGRTLNKALKESIGKLKAEADGGTKNLGDGKQEKKIDNDNKKKEKHKQQTEKGDMEIKNMQDKIRSGGDEGRAERRPPALEMKTRSPASAAGSTHSRQSEVRFTMAEWITLQEDDLFSFEELQLLSEIIMKDRHVTWLRVASIFLDKTGRRVHPDDIADKFRELAAMAR